jgi:hypothetical protein
MEAFLVLKRLAWPVERESARVKGFKASQAEKHSLSSVLPHSNASQEFYSSHQQNSVAVASASGTQQNPAQK